MSLECINGRVVRALAPCTEHDKFDTGEQKMYEVVDEQKLSLSERYLQTTGCDSETTF